MKKVFVFIILGIIFFNINLVQAHGNEINNTYEKKIVSDAIEKLNVKEYDYEINKNIKYNENLNISFSEILKEIFSGNFNVLNPFNIINKIIKILFSEIFINSKIIKNILIISILCAILKVFSDSFKNKGASEIGFYVGYMAISILLIKGFNLALGVIIETITSVSNIINSLIPLLSGILVMSGVPTGSIIFTGSLVVFINFVTFIINKIFVPLISSMVILSIINYITPKEVLNKLLEFLKWGTSFGIRAVAILFAFMLSFQKVATPIVSSVINKTAKTAVNFLPIVGDIINGTIDSVIHFMGLIKGGVGFATVIIICIACLIPILKLISFVIIYKITAILIEPISDKRITFCIDSIGEYIKMILSTLFIFVFLFVLIITVILSISV